MTNGNGVMKNEKACGHVLMPQLLVMTTNAANRQTETVSKAQTEIINGFNALKEIASYAEIPSLPNKRL